MSELVWFRSYVEHLLREMWEQPELVVDADGDYPSRYGSSAVWVRIEDGFPMAVRIFAHAALGVKKTARLLTELNEITANTRFGSVHWSGGVVVTGTATARHRQRTPRLGAADAAAQAS
jgi:hypothetical protein